MENKRKRGLPARLASERIMDHIVIDSDTGCWMWQASCNGAGYPQIKGDNGSAPVFAHRVSYELVKGPIPFGEVIDHLCYSEEGISNRLCINPDHLEAVTQKVNMQRWHTQRKAKGIPHYMQGRVAWNKGKTINKETGKLQ